MDVEKYEESFIKFWGGDDAKNNKYLACKDFVGYLSNINKANIELMEVHNKILIVAKQILEGK